MDAEEPADVVSWLKAVSDCAVSDVLGYFPFDKLSVKMTA
jgi:hypothetical protein